MSGALFISHASGDAKVAAELCDALEGRGFDCWLASRDVAPGENFQVAIVRAIRGARMLLLVFTGAANSSDEVAKELALASQARIAVVPLKVEDVAPSEALAYEFATRQWIDFHTDWTRAVEQLCRHVSSALGVEAAAVPPASPPAPPPPPPLADPSNNAGERPGERVRNRVRESVRGARIGEAAVELALERARTGRGRYYRSTIGSVRTLIMVAGLIILFVVLLPWLKRLTDAPRPANALAPPAAAPATPPSTAPSNSEVPF